MTRRIDLNLKNSPPLRRPVRAWSSWLISFSFHGLLCAGLLLQLERQGLPDGSTAGGTAKSLTLLASFSHQELPNPSGAQFTTEIPDTAEAPDQPESMEANSTTEQPVPPDEENAVAISNPSNDPPEQDPAETAATETPTEESSTPVENRQTGDRLAQAAARLASRTQSVISNAGLPSGNAISGTTEGNGEGDRFGSPDGTSFFQVRAQGRHFCYVVDCSSSMEDGNTIELARNELNASLRRLDRSRQFQILFYNAEVFTMTDRGKAVFLATDTERRLAHQFMLAQQPAGRAIHRPALEAALASKPDVIFFLTDGEVPELTARDLYELKAANRYRTRIHVIEFGSGAKLETNWLERLARDHKGSHRYIDIDALRQPE